MACCRSCLATNRELHSMHKSSKDAIGISYMDCFQLLGCSTNADILPDKFVVPTSMCEPCLNELRIAFAFRQRCKRSLDELQERYRRRFEEATKELGDGDHVEVLEEELIEILDDQSCIIEPYTEEVAAFDENESECFTSTGNQYHSVEPTTVDYEESVVGEDYFPGSERIVEEVETISDDAVSCAADVESTTYDDDVLVEEMEEIVDEYYLVEEVNDAQSSHENESDETIIPNIQSDKSVSLKCMLCRINFDDRLEYSHHMQTAHEFGSAKACEVCGIFCTSGIALRNHMLLHTNAERPFKCDICPKSYFSKPGIVNHMAVHSGKINPLKFLCSECGKGFSTSQRLKVHSAVHTDVKNFQCDECEKMFTNETKLRCHKRTHTGERPYHCNTCGLRFAQSNALRCHLRTHTGEKPYKCPICEKAFTQNTILKTHMTLHTGKTVKCPDCDKKFSRPSYLILHRREHTGEKPYQCSHCPMAYKQKGHLDRHVDTHLGIKHVCPVCAKAYSKMYTLKQHMLTHTDSKHWPFQCDQCGTGFVRKDKYTLHMRSQHETDVKIENSESDR